MKRTEAGRGAMHISVLGVLVLALAANHWSPAPAEPVTAQNCRNMNKIDVCGRFLEVWNTHGSDQANIYVNGLPITPLRNEINTTDGKTYGTQWFERARYEAHPENKAPYDVLLGLLGVALSEGRGAIDPSTGKVRNPADVAFVGVDKPSDADGTNKIWFQETRHTISGKIYQYWKQYGGLQQFGFPLSEQFQEVSAQDGKTYTVQYFERNRFELHPEFQDPYAVELGLLGSEQYKLTPIPPEQIPSAGPADPPVTTLDTATIAMSQMPASLFTFFQGSFAASVASRPIYASLVTSDANENLYSEAGYYVPTIENGGAAYVGTGGDRHLSVKYKLRHNIHWSDGVEITAADIYYTYKLQLDPRATIADRTLAWKIADVEIPDKYTFIVNYMSYNQAQQVYQTARQEQRDVLTQFIDEKRPVIDSNYNFAVDILPEHILGKIPADRIEASDYARAPVGAGPYMVQDKNWAAAGAITLVPNPRYDIGPKPVLKKIVIKIIADTNQIIAQLKSGALDGAISNDFTGGPSPVLDSFAANGQVVDAVPARVWEHFDFNLDRPFFQDKRVRQAFAYTIDRQNIVNQVYLGKTQVLDTFLPPLSWGSEANPDFPKNLLTSFPLHTYKPDLNKANQLLDQAGWTKGADGIRQKNGVRFSIKISGIADDKTREQTIRLVMADLHKAGVEAAYNPVPVSDFLAPDGFLGKRQFDMAIYAWVLDPDPGGQLYDSNLIPSQANNYSGQNYPGYKNDRFDQLSRATANEIDRNVRLPMLAEMQSIWTDELPALPLYAQSNIDVHKSTLQNWKPSGGTTPETWNVAQWYFQ